MGMELCKPRALHHCFRLVSCQYSIKVERNSQGFILIIVVKL
ncbi:hypothetical protein WQQ_42770 [Hydrocarboniphaga effusa AP103]|uniref:Uncharacterized protein n=1 Tax=Hydrocarboniphaga effusa AP103 TaxID=1172194 RepID=I7Z865_9GAMM|nr:hypothetical protein WQQ_42770 [Hydrocarboniphaga effusa AP103]